MDSGAPAVMAPEETLWTGRPSHLNNLVVYIVCTLLVIPIVYAIWRWLQLNCTTYELTNQRLRITTGVFNREEDELNSTESKTSTTRNHSSPACLASAT